MAKTSTKYPRKVYQLTPSMSVREITLTGPAMRPGWGIGRKPYELSGYAVDEKGREHYLAHLHASRGAAIAAAEKKMAEQEARLEKAKANVARRRANLEKAKGAA